jgi:hypothetical protein
MLAAEQPSRGRILDQVQGQAYNHGGIRRRSVTLKVIRAVSQPMDGKRYNSLYIKSGFIVLGTIYALENAATGAIAPLAAFLLLFSPTWAPPHYEIID